MHRSNVKQGLSFGDVAGKAFRMSHDASNKMSREERLAAKLRENLRRRKAQSRAMDAPEAAESALPKDDSVS